MRRATSIIKRQFQEIGIASAISGCKIKEYMMVIYWMLISFPAPLSKVGTVYLSQRDSQRFGRHEEQWHGLYPRSGLRYLPKKI